MTKPLCIYHGNCADGFGAAWAVRAHLGSEKVDFYGATYQQAPPDVTGRDVIMVDFSYKRPVLEAMGLQAKSILILDHHKSAAADLAGYPEPPADLGEMRGWLPDSGIYARFDMERSGAGLAWDHFHPGPRPTLLNHIEDRDLWRFALTGTRKIQAAVFSYPYDFDLWDKLMDSPVDMFAVEGAAIERKHFKDIAELIGVCTRKFPITVPHPDGMVGGTVELDIEFANLPYTLTSDAGHDLAKRSHHGVGGCYWDTPEARVFSLRSTDNGLDVSAIASIYGGGGHAHAAGFSVPRGHSLARL